MNQYLLHGKLSALSGKGDDLEKILLEASQLMSSAKGCKLYMVSRDVNQAEDIWITEIWDSKEDHDNSLSVPGVKELIGQAMPILDGMPQKGQELKLKGGHGIS